MAVVVSVSLPEDLHTRWKESDLEISPSALFQQALLTKLEKKDAALSFWSNRALSAEKKLTMISKLIDANDKDVKKFLLLHDDR